MEEEYDESEWVHVYHKSLTSSDSVLVATKCLDDVGARTSGELELCIPSGDCNDNVHVHGLTSGLGDLEIQKSEQCELADGPSSHPECSPQVDDLVDFDNRSFSEQNKMKCDGESSEEKTVIPHRSLKKSAPIDIPKRNMILSVKEAEVATVCRVGHVSYSYSMMEGVGRTLKGRDLIRVRNHEFRLTDFIED